MTKGNEKYGLGIITIALLSAFFFITAETSNAAVNPKFAYQGKLKDSTGLTVPDGSYNLRFRICQDSSCSTVLATETHCYSTDNGSTCTGSGTDQRIAVSGGIFNLLIGSITDISTLNFNQTLYLEVQVGGLNNTPTWETLLPRKELASVPSSMNSAKLDNLSASSTGDDEHILKTDALGTITSSADISVADNLNIGTDVILFRGNTDRLDLASGDSLNIISGSVQFAGTTIINSSREIQNITQATIDNININGNTIAATNDSGLNFHNNDGVGIIIDDNGYVGMGTNTPTNKLSVFHNVDGAIAAFRRVGATNNPGLWIHVDESSDLVSLHASGATGSENFAFFTGSNERMRIDGLTGNVGIGTTASPEYPLDLHRSGTSAAINMRSDTNGTFILGQRSLGTLASPVAPNGEWILLSMAGGGYDGTSWVIQKGQITINSESAWSLGDNPTFIKFETTPDGSSTLSEAMRITSAGYVGIGITNPGEKLEVQDGVNGAKMKVSNTVGGYAQLSISSNTNSIASLDFTNSLSLNGGNVGIGTTSPTSPLTVKNPSGEAIVGQWQNADYAAGSAGNMLYHGFGATSGQTYYQMQSTRLGNTQYADLILQPSGGYIGIGDDTPSYKLDVTGDVNSTGGFYENGVKITSGSYWTLSGSNLYNTGANVGIGTTSPATTLDVNGTITSRDIMPEMTGASGNVSVRNIGDSTHRFANLWADEVHIGASSLYVNDKKVIEDVSNVMNFRTDTDQAMLVQTSGVGTLTLQSGNAALTLNTNNLINSEAKGGMQWNVPSDNATKHINFSNASANGNITFVASGTNSQVQFGAVDEIDLTASLIDINGNVNISGTITSGSTWNGNTIGVAYGGTGATTLSSNYLLKGSGTSAIASSIIYDDGTNVGIGGNLTIPNAGYIGSASDTDAMQIEADGDVVLSQKLGIGVTPGYLLDVSNGEGVVALFGGDIDSKLRTDNYSKYGRIAFPHYDNDQKPSAFMFGLSNESTTILRVGGGSEFMNTATGIEFYTAGDNVTSSNNSSYIKMAIDSVGIVKMPYVYAHDMNSETMRTLMINSSGELGYNSNINVEADGDVILSQGLSLTGTKGIGVYTVPSAQSGLSISDLTFETTSTHYGIYDALTKTGGITDYDDMMFGINAAFNLNQSGGEIGYLYGGVFTAGLYNGSVGSSSNNRNMYGSLSQAYTNGGTVNGTLYGGFHNANLDAGTITGNVLGTYSNVDIESGVAVSGNVYGHLISVADDAGATGTVYGLYLSSQAGVDYAIYQTGATPSYLSGKLRIGTLPSSSYALDVSGSDFYTLRLGGGIPLIKFANPDYNSGNGAELYQNDSGSIFLNVNSSTGVFNANASGNIGIGTTDLSARLEIMLAESNGNGGRTMRLRDAGGRNLEFGFGNGTHSNLPTQSAYIGKTWNDSANGGLVFFSGGGTPTTGGIQFYTGLMGAESEAMRISQDGKVGIGTTAPSAKLHVAGDAGTMPTIGNTTQLLVTNNDTAGDNSVVSIIGGTTGNSILAFGDSGDENIGQITYSHTNNDMTFRTNAIDRVVLDSSGNVGIGTTTPSYALDVLPPASITALFGGDAYARSRTDNTDKYARLATPHYDIDQKPVAIAFSLNSASDNTLRFGGGSSMMKAVTAIQFYTAEDNVTDTGSVRMTINSTGQVGINASSFVGTEKIRVNGSVYVDTSIIVNGTTLNVPDYVFEPEYQLRPMEELEEFISSNRHLPGVVSRDEIKQNGLNYNTMMLSILEKTEENTLYIIDNYKKISALEINDENQITDISDSKLRTDSSISTTAELKSSIDANFVTINNAMSEISSRLDDSEAEISNHEERISELEKLEDQMETIQANNQAVINFSEALNFKDIDGDLSMSFAGKFKMEGVETGNIIIRIIDKDARTIGTAAIEGVEKDENGDVIIDEATGNNGKSVTIKTKALTENSKIFVTSKNVTSQPLAVTNRKDGESFDVEIENALDKDDSISFDWWIVEVEEE